MRLRVAVVTAVVMLAATGCGGSPARVTGSAGGFPSSVGHPRPSAAGTAGASVGVPAGPSAAAPTSSPAPPAAITVTAGPQEATARLVVGQAVLVRPAPGRPGRANAVVAEVGSAVLRSDGGSSATGWRFVAQAPGTAHVVVSYGPQCLPGELCPMFRGLLSRVTVTVD